MAIQESEAKRLEENKINGVYVPLKERMTDRVCVCSHRVCWTVGPLSLLSTDLNKQLLRVR